MIHSGEACLTCLGLEHPHYCAEHLSFEQGTDHHSWPFSIQWQRYLHRRIHDIPSGTTMMNESADNSSKWTLNSIHGWLPVNPRQSSNRILKSPQMVGSKTISWSIADSLSVPLSVGGAAMQYYTQKYLFTRLDPILFIGVRSFQHRSIDRMHEWLIIRGTALRDKSDVSSVSRCRVKRATWSTGHK
jgi:hypothetical protein